MLDFSKIHVTLRANFNDAKGEVITLHEALFSDRWEFDALEVREASQKERKRLKKCLPCFTPSGTFQGLDKTDIVTHSGLVCIDIDHDPMSDKPEKNPNVANFADMKKLIRDVPNVAYCGQSVGGDGFFCLIPIADPARHEEHYQALADDFLRCGLHIDTSCAPVNKLRYVSYDPNPYVNLEAEIYNRLPASAKTPPDRQRPPKAPGGGDDLERLREYVTRNRVDITGGYEQWFDILCGIASEMGEAGEGYAQDISSQYPGYDPDETAKTYREACKHHGYNYTKSTIFYYAEKAGITSRLLNDSDFNHLNFK